MTRQVEKAKRTETKIDRHDHHIALLRKHSPIIFIGRSGDEASTVDPDQDRAKFAFRGWRNDIQKQAVFAQLTRNFLSK